MAKRMKWLCGQILRMLSLMGGGYLIIITFGMEPLETMSRICQMEHGWTAAGGTFLQVLKMIFGIGYSFIGMVILYRIGGYLVSRNKTQRK